MSVAIIRLATNADLAGVQAVARRTWQVTYRGLIPEDVQQRLLSQWYALENLERSLTTESSWLFVAKIGMEIVGFAQFVLRRDGSGQLTRIYILPEHQVEGIGGALLEKGVKALKELEVKELRVVVERDNLVGRRFYEAKGFRWLRDFEDEIRDNVIGIFRMPSREYVLSLNES